MKRSGPPKRNKGLNRRSKKTAKKYEERRPLVQSLLAERPACEACGVFASYDNQALFIQRRSVDIHEVKRRSRGGDILDESILVAVCRPCHRRIGYEPALAELLGLEVPSWATPEMIEEAGQVRSLWRDGVPNSPSWLDSFDSEE